MKRIIITSPAPLEYNFGIPSILHGVEELIKILYDQYELIYYQRTPLLFSALKDMELDKRTLNHSAFKVFSEFWKIKLFGKSKNKEIFELVTKIKNSDVVVDIYGICFCDDLGTINKKSPLYILKTSFLNIAKNSIMNYILLYIAKKNNVKTAKNTSSFGPAKSKYNRRIARFSCKYIFDVIVAREKKSRDVLLQDAKVKKDILLAPDIANLMPFTPPSNNNIKKIGISTSHKIVSQWNSKESYISCITNLCKYIDDKYSYPILLIPNEFNPNRKKNDINVSVEIQSKLKENGVTVEILDVANMTSTEIKNEIASCEIMVASRYHSCVAALSSGIPTLVIGWHYKYEELLHWYGQEEWLLSHNNCDTKLLIEKFDKLWEQRDYSRKTIAEKYPVVKQAIIEVGKKVFS